MSWDLEEKNEYSVPYIKEGLTYIVMDAKLPSQMGTPEVRGYCIRIERELPPPSFIPQKGKSLPFGTLRAAFESMREICPEWDLPHLE